MRHGAITTNIQSLVAIFILDGGVDFERKNEKGLTEAFDPNSLYYPFYIRKCACCSADITVF